MDRPRPSLGFEASDPNKDKQTSTARPTETVQELPIDSDSWEITTSARDFDGPNDI